MEIDFITGQVIDASVKIHSTIGPGCFERVYEELLNYELHSRKISVQRQLLMPVTYESLFIGDAYKVDFLIENKLVVEIKSAERVLPVHFKQINTYLKLLELKHGLLLNFNVEFNEEWYSQGIQQFRILKLFFSFYSFVS